MKRILLLLLLFVFLWQCSEGTEIHLPSSLEGNYKTPGVFFGNSPKHFHLYGFVVEGKPFRGCDHFDNNEEIKGNIVLIDAGNCYPQQKMENAQKAGAIGAIIKTYDYLGTMTYIYDGHKHNDLKIPVVEMSGGDVSKIKDTLNDGQNVTVTISPDSNPFAQSNSLAVWVPFSVVFILWDFCLLGLAVYRLQGFIYFFKLQASVPQGCLLLQIASSTVRILWEIDPRSLRRIYPDWFGTNLLTSRTPLWLAATLLVSFYWKEITDRSNNCSTVLPRLRKMKWPFVVTVTIITALEISSWVPRALFIDTTFVTVVITVVSCITIVAISIFYIIMGSKIIKIFKHSTAEKTKSSQTNLYRITILIVMNAVLSILQVLGSLMFIALGQSPWGIVFVYYWITVMALGISTCQIIIFRRPTSSQNSSENNQNSSKETEGRKVSVNLTTDSEL